MIGVDMNSFDQDLSNDIPDVQTPFKVVDEGYAFRVEIAIQTKKDGITSYHFAARVYDFATLASVGPIPEPKPYGWAVFDEPLTEIMFNFGVGEYVRADAEVVAKAWFQYRQKQRTSYIATVLTNLFKMATNEKKPVTYLGQVFESKLFTGVIIVLTLCLVYTGSLKLFGDWNTYYDPWSAKGTANWIFYASLIILAVAFLVPLFSKEQVSARRTQAAEKPKVDASGYYPEQPVKYNDGSGSVNLIPATYVGIDKDGQLIITIGFGPYLTVAPSQVTAA